MRAALFRVCSVKLQRKDDDNAVHAFMDMKCAVGKHYFVYMFAVFYLLVRTYDFIRCSNTDSSSRYSYIVLSVYRPPVSVME